MPPVGFAVLGLGTLAQTAILPAFRNVQTAKLVGLVSRDVEKARRLAKSKHVCSRVGYQARIAEGRQPALRSAALIGEFAGDLAPARSDSPEDSLVGHENFVQVDLIEVVLACHRQDGEMPTPGAARSTISWDSPS